MIGRGRACDPQGRRVPKLPSNHESAFSQTTSPQGLALVAGRVTSAKPDLFESSPDAFVKVPPTSPRGVHQLPESPGPGGRCACQDRAVGSPGETCGHDRYVEFGVRNNTLSAASAAAAGSCSGHLCTTASLLCYALSNAPLS